MEMPHRVYNQFSDFPTLQMTSTGPSIKVTFHLPAKVAADLVFRVIDRLASTDLILQPAQLFRFLTFKLKKHFGRERIRQTKCNEIPRALAFHMWKVSATVNASPQRILVARLRPAGTQLIARSFQGPIRFARA